MQKAGEWR